VVITLGSLIPTAGFEANIGERLFDVFPAEVADTLRPAVEELLRTPRSGLFGLGLAITLWTGSSSVEAFRSACNQAFTVKSQLPWWLRRLQAVAIMLIGAGGMLGLAFLLYAGLLAEAWLGGKGDAAIESASEWDGFRPVILLAGVFGFIALLFRWLPGTRVAWNHVLIGSGLVVALWVGGGACVSLYIAAVSTVNPIYAALGGVIGVMVFFYFFAAVMVLGIELVAELEARAALWNRIVVAAEEDDSGD
jgi:membrane protein